MTVQQPRLVVAQCAPLPSNTIQVTIELPRKVLLAKDYLNHKYHARRLLYLQHVAEALQASKLTKRGVRMKTSGNDLRSPCLHYVDQATDCAVLVSTSLPLGTFQCTKLAPARNCLRSVTLPSKGSEHPQPAATPTYNASILWELLHHSMSMDLARILASPQLQAVACLCSKLLAAQVPESLHTNSLLEGVLTALAHAVQYGKVVCFRQLPCVSRMFQRWATVWHPGAPYDVLCMDNCQTDGPWQWLGSAS